MCRVSPPPTPRCSAEYQRNKDVVISMLLQVCLGIDNPFAPDASEKK